MNEIAYTPEADERARRLRVAAVLAAGVVAAFLVWLIFIRDDNGSGVKRAKPVAATIADLRALQGAVGHAVYWVGPKPGYSYELTRTGDGNIYVRYLPPGVAIGDPRPNFLTVGTYPDPNAFNTVTTAAKNKDARVKHIPKGGLSVTRSARPTSVYLAYPNSGLLLEVYDPSPAKARRAVVSGSVIPVR
jgi:hypothetical protein